MSIRSTTFALLFAGMSAAFFAREAFSWDTVFEVRSGNGRPVQEYTIQHILDPQSTVTIGLEVGGIRIGYDSRHGLAAVKEF
ncbi:MAG: hypothetical protein HY913_12690 [Desulfomonile tiedjei]|nr:hypothetical protein [Desulfomonile tiedjei]